MACNPHEMAQECTRGPSVFLASVSVHQYTNLRTPGPGCFFFLNIESLASMTAKHRHACACFCCWLLPVPIMHKTPVRERKAEFDWVCKSCSTLTCSINKSMAVKSESANMFLWMHANTIRQFHPISQCVTFRWLRPRGTLRMRCGLHFTKEPYHISLSIEESQHFSRFSEDAPNFWDPGGWPCWSRKELNFLSALENLNSFLRPTLPDRFQNWHDFVVPL